MSQLAGPWAMVRRLRQPDSRKSCLTFNYYILSLAPLPALMLHCHVSNEEGTRSGVPERIESEGVLGGWKVSLGKMVCSGSMLYKTGDLSKTTVTVFRVAFA